MNTSMKFALFTALLLAASAVQAFAGAYDIKEMTPEIQNALSSRQQRYAELQQLKAQGAVGENSRGYVEVLKDGGNAGSIAASENSDRKVIYQAIVQQNNLGPQGLGAVETAFAEVQRDKARGGDWVQSPSGQWSQR